MADKIHPGGNAVRMLVGVLGIVVALTAALLLFLGAIESGWAIVILIIGIGLMSTRGVTAGTDSDR
jgi:high-affinity Fe2+/Pb2+ permease